MYAGAPAIATDIVRRYRMRVRNNAKRLSKPSRRKRALSDF